MVQVNTRVQKGGQRPQGEATVTTALQPPKISQGLLSEMAGKRHLEPRKFWDAIRFTIFSNKGTQEEMIAFLTVCDKYGLDPFLREIYAFPRKGGGIQPVISVDGWITLMNRQKEMDGVTFDSQFDADGKIYAVTCTIHRKDRTHPTIVTEYFVECFRATDPWKQTPCRMLRHKALSQCVRVAFGLAGVVDQDEVEGMFEAGVVTTFESLPDVPEVPFPGIDQQEQPPSADFEAREKECSESIKAAKNQPKQDVPSEDWDERFATQIGQAKTSARLAAIQGDVESLWNDGKCDVPGLMALIEGRRAELKS